MFAQALDRCTPNLEFERNGDTFVLSYQKASAGEDLTQLDVKAGTSAYEAIQLLVHKGMKVDFSQVAWKQHNFTEPDSFGNRYNILREPISASSNEDALNQILALTRPAVAYDRAGDVYQLHYAYPIVHKKIDATSCWPKCCATSPPSPVSNSIKPPLTPRCQGSEVSAIRTLS